MSEYTHVNNNTLFESDVSKLVENDPELCERLNQLLGGGNDFMNEYLMSVNDRIKEGIPHPKSLKGLLKDINFVATAPVLDSVKTAAQKMGIQPTETEMGQYATQCCQHREALMDSQFMKKFTSNQSSSVNDVKSLVEEIGKQYQSGQNQQGAMLPQKSNSNVCTRIVQQLRKSSKKSKHKQKNNDHSATNKGKPDRSGQSGPSAP